MRAPLIVLTLGCGLAALVAPAALQAAPEPRTPPPPQRPEPKAPEPKAPGQEAPDAPTPKAPGQLQKEADRHFKNGVALFKDAKYGDALAEFEQAYEIAPHPLVLYNIAGCHRELLHYPQAVRSYQRFLSDGQNKVSAARLAAARAELDAVLALVARLTVVVTPASDAAALTLDGAPLDKPEMPLILMPGEYRLAAHAAGRRDAEQAVRLAAGDKLTVQLALGELATPRSGKDVTAAPAPLPSRPRLSIDAGFGMNLRRVGNTGAPSIGLGAELGSRLGVGVEVVLVAYAVIPSLRVRVAGDALSLHVIGAVPIAFPDDSMTGRFIAIAGGLGLRYRATPRLAFRLESYVSVAGKDQGTALPAFLGGELWF
jgi:hypothetical protein